MDRRHIIDTLLGLGFKRNQMSDMRLYVINYLKDVEEGSFMDVKNSCQAQKKVDDDIKKEKANPVYTTCTGMGGKGLGKGRHGNLDACLGGMVKIGMLVRPKRAYLALSPLLREAFPIPDSDSEDSLSDISGSLGSSESLE